MTEDRSMEVEVLASMLRDDQRHGGDWLEHLATKLTGALPQHTQVERKGGFLGFGAQKVHHIAVDMGETRYTLTRERHGPVARKVKVVRAVELSKREVPTEEWIADLAAAIKSLAERSAETARALEKFVMGD
jgi:hypothetical protein